MEFLKRADPQGTQVNETILASLVMLLLSLVVCSRCSLNPYYPEEPYMDSSVYLYIAKVMRSGGVMYRDVFDHKGPLLYLINYLGTVINARHGVWLLELASFFLTSLFSFKIVRRFCSVSLSLLGAVCAVLLLSSFFNGGNNPEEYALPFITGSLLIFTEYFADGAVSRKKLLLCGLCWMAVMLIRPNMIGCWIVFCVAVLIREIREKTLRIGRFLGWFLLGAALLLLPILAYLMMEGALDDFWSQYILFNFVYTGAEDVDRFTIMTYYMCQPPVLLSICTALICSCYDKELRELAIIECCFVVAVVCLTGISGRTYAHYGVALMPLYVLPMAFALRALQNATKGHILFYAGVAAVTLGLLTPWLRSIKSLPRRTPYSQSAKFVLSAIIAENTTPEDKIIACGNSDLFYICSDRMAASKYSYQLPIGEADPAIYDEFLEELSNDPPKVIVTSVNTVNGILDLDELNLRMDAFIAEHGYHAWFQAAGYSVYGQEPLDESWYRSPN